MQPSGHVGGGGSLKDSLIVEIALFRVIGLDSSVRLAWNPLDLDRAPEGVKREAEISRLRSAAFESSGCHVDGVGVAVGVFYPVQSCSKSFSFFLKGRGDSPDFDAGAMQNFGVRRAPSRDDKPCTSVPDTIGCRAVRIDDQVSTRVADDADRFVFRVVTSVLS